MLELEVINTTPDREIITERIFNFPKELIFKAWIDPEHLKEWWGPNGFTNTISEYNLKSGGRWIFTMHGPDKRDYANECIFIKINEPDILIWNHSPKPYYQGEATFEKITESKTKVTYKMKFESAEVCNKLKPFVPEKNEENMDRLEAELNKMLQSNDLNKNFNKSNEPGQSPFTQTYFHGTKADLKIGGFIETGINSNYGQRKKAKYIYLTATLDAAIWGAELASGERRERIYLVEPIGKIEDDPNLTNKKFPGNPTMSYRSEHPFKVVGEVTIWRGHSQEQINAMKDGLAKLKAQGIEAIED